MTNTIKTVTPNEAWDMMNELDWETDARCESLHDALVKNERLGSAFVEVLNEIFEVDVDLEACFNPSEEDIEFGWTQIDIVDELDNLAHGNYAGLDF